MDDLKLKCLGGMINTITVDNGSEIVDIFDNFDSRDLLTGEMSWKFLNYIDLSILAN